VKLFSPADSYNLYPFGVILDIEPRGHHSYCGFRDNHWSQVGLDKSEEEIRQKFPRYFDTKPMVCVVEEGEMLYIPGGWWHQVTSYGVHIAVNIWTEL